MAKWFLVVGLMGLSVAPGASAGVLRYSGGEAKKAAVASKHGVVVGAKATAVASVATVKFLKRVVW